MAVLHPNRSPPTLPVHMPYRLIAHFLQSPISFTSDMSDEPGVQFMGARSKVSNVHPVQARRPRQR